MKRADPPRPEFKPYRVATMAVEAELSTCFMGSAWRVLWLLFEDYGLKPDDIDVGCDGLAGDYAPSDGPRTRPTTRTATSWYTRPHTCCIT